MIKSINETKPTKLDDSLPYPKLMKFVGVGDGEFVVLFSSPGTGVVVSSNNILRPLGQFAEDWCQPGVIGFENYNETVCIQNVTK